LRKVIIRTGLKNRETLMWDFRAMIVAAALVVGGTAALAEGYLATDIKPLPDLVFGSDSAGFAVSQAEYKLETGKAYQLSLVSSGKREYAIRGDDFFNFIWVRKIEVNDVEIKATGIYEIEMEREGKATLVFVPIRPGNYRLYAKGLESKGAVARIIVK
jgi:hypothetical protein